MVVIVKCIITTIARNLKFIASWRAIKYELGEDFWCGSRNIFRSSDGSELFMVWSALTLTYPMLESLIVWNVCHKIDQSPAKVQKAWRWKSSCHKLTFELLFIYVQTVFFGELPTKSFLKGINDAYGRLKIRQKIRQIKKQTLALNIIRTQVKHFKESGQRRKLKTTSNFAIKESFIIDVVCCSSQKIHIFIFFQDPLSKLEKLGKLIISPQPLVQSQSFHIFRVMSR